ncbi:hypothetical protein KIW84_071280 [Lathyrus oleraceus]|uniref:C3H1-type domain-containing protein n=1 Tax=Pisum sativum TaxID=3888 RepID=A0A9D4VIC8_PEA|nr:hypothetical protein KIW84_071280 [Pisum sativum]
MSGSGRKLSSNRVSRDEPEFSPESATNSNSSRYLERNDMINPRMGFSCKDPFSGGRSSRKDDVWNPDYKVLDATIAQDTDGSYDMKASPGFEELKNRKHSQSVKNDYGRRSRSRSRSPRRGLRYSAVDDENRMRVGRLIRPCRDFAVGNCRRGSHCHFLHHDKQSYEDSRESRYMQDGPRYCNHRESGDYSITSRRSNEACIHFAKGRCRAGESCKYVHHGNSDEFDKVSADESSREREIDRRHIDNSFKQGGPHYPNHSGNTPCKFFAFGNCRNGKDCRFSHDRQAFTSHIRRLRDDRSRSNQGEDQVLDRQIVSNSVTPNERLRDGRRGSDGSMADVDKVLDGPKLNNLVNVSETAKLVQDNKKGILGAPETGFMAWPMNNGLDHSLDRNRMHNESPFTIDKKEANCRTAENAANNILISQSVVGGGFWPGDEKMSPDWNYGARSSSHINDEHGQNKQQGAPGQGLNQNAQNLTASHVVGQSQATVSIVPPRSRIIEGLQNQELFTNASLLQIGSGNTPTQNVVSKEQLSCLSASLAHFLGTNQQLSQLHSTINSCDANDTLFGSKIEGQSSKQYDPMCDIMEPKNINASGVSPTFSPNTKIPKDTARIPPLLSNPGQYFDQYHKKETSKMDAEKTAISQSENKITEENSPLVNTSQNDGPDEAKKLKDVKGIRAFKTSLVELIKEILKPTWKDGKVSKEDYKSIVKKVTDKVTSTVNRVHIPQTQEKIERYLSVSKPKLNKLVQVIVE